MYRSEQVLANDSLGEHDSILIVVTFPRDVSHLEVLTECQLTSLCCVTFGQQLTFGHHVALANDRVQVNRGVLVGLFELRHLVFFLCRVEGYELLVLVAVVADTDDVCVYVGHLAIAFCLYLGAAVFNQLLLDTGSYDRCLGGDQWHSLAHHVRSHQCTVGIVMLQERNKRSCYRSDLARSHVHEVHLIRCYHREVGAITRFNFRTDERTILTQRGVTLCYGHVLLVLGGEEYHVVVIQIYDAVLCLTIRGLDESEIVDLGIDTERGDQTDVRSFRSLDRTETTVVGIVYVTYLESGTVTTQTARTQGRHTTLVSDLGQRVLLIHELAQGVGTEV